MRNTLEITTKELLRAIKNFEIALDATYQRNYLNLRNHGCSNPMPLALNALNDEIKTAIENEAISSSQTMGLTNVFGNWNPKPIKQVHPFPISSRNGGVA